MDENKINSGVADSVRGQSGTVGGVQDGSVGNFEAQEAASMGGEPVDSGLTEEAPGIAQNDLKGQNGQKKSKKWLWILAILLVVVIACVLVALLILKPWESGGDKKSDQGGSSEVLGEDKKEEGEEKDKDGFAGEENNKNDTEEARSELRELGVDDALVQKLWKQVEQVHYAYGNGYTHRLYDDEAIGELNRGEEAIRIYVAAMAVMNETNGSVCRNPYPYVGHDGCLSGEEVREKARKIFGTELVLTDGDGFMYAPWGASYEYNEEYDEFNTFKGKTGEGLDYQVVYKAEQDADHVYFYVEFGDIVGDTMDGPFYLKGDGLKREVDTLSREEKIGLTNHYKWIFKKTDTGDYIFESLEKAEP